MWYELRSTDNRVLCDSHDALERHEVRIFTTKALTRRQRRSLQAHGIDFDGTLDRDGYMRFSIEAARIKRLLRDKDPTVVVRGWTLPDNRFGVQCEGDLADLIINRVNALLKPKVAKAAGRKQHHLRSVARKKRLEEKRKKLEEARKARQKPAPKKAKKRLEHPLALRRNIPIVPQFKKSRDLTWHEAVRAAVTIFQINGSECIPAQERVDILLRRSLERSKKRGGRRYAVMKRDGFELRFCLNTTSWCGDLTKLRIWCSNLKGHPLYKRTRRYFKGVLQNRSREQEMARRRLEAALERDYQEILIAA